MREKAEKFLKRYGMHADQVDSYALLSAFHCEMEAGLSGRESSLGMYSSYTALYKPVAPCKVTAVDAGGTHLRVAQVAVGYAEIPQIEIMDTYPMAGTSGSLTKSEFFESLAQTILPYIQPTGRLGISFAFPGEITPDKDLLIGGMAKEIEIEAIQGASLRQNLNDAFFMLSGNRYDISAVNDGVASLLGTAPASLFDACDAMVGIIIGTGTNTCYKERCEKIIKNEYPSDRTHDIVNVESGCFSKYDGGVFDRMLDARSSLPKDHLFEKKIGGKYLGELLTIACAAAADEGLIGANQSIVHFKDAGDVDASIKSVPRSEQEAFIQDLAAGVVKRAAKLAALSIASPVLLRAVDIKTAYIAFEGSTVLRSQLLWDEIDKQLAVLLGDCLYEKRYSENSVLKGTALSSLLIG